MQYKGVPFLFRSHRATLPSKKCSQDKKKTIYKIVSNVNKHQISSVILSLTSAPVVSQQSCRFMFGSSTTRRQQAFLTNWFKWKLKAPKIQLLFQTSKKSGVKLLAAGSTYLSKISKIPAGCDTSCWCIVVMYGYFTPTQKNNPLMLHVYCLQSL